MNDAPAAPAASAAPAGWALSWKDAKTLFTALVAEGGAQLPLGGRSEQHRVAATKIAMAAFESLAQGHEPEAARLLMTVAAKKQGSALQDDRALLALFDRLTQGLPPLPVEALMRAALPQRRPILPRQLGNKLRAGAIPLEVWAEVNEDLYYALDGAAALYAEFPERFSAEGLAAEWEETFFALQRYGEIDAEW